MADILTIKNLTKIYDANDGKKQVLQNIDLTVKEGAFFGLLGPNGAGKSTLINIIASVVKKTSGTINIGGFDLDENVEQVKRSIGVVPQEIVFDPFFTVREALINHAGYFGIANPEEKISEIINAVGLKSQADYNTRKLSGGMKRRLLIAKALINDPKLLFLDEPTAGVDIELREQLWEYVKKLNKAGTTVILTTHYLEEAEELCSDIAVINGGRIVTQQSKAQLLSQCYNKVIKITFDKKINKKEIDKYIKLKYEKKDSCSAEFFCKKSKDFDLLIAGLKNLGNSVVDIETINVKLEDVIKNLFSNTH